MIESYGIQIMSPLLTNGSTEQDMLWALRNLSDKDSIDHLFSKVDVEKWIISNLKNGRSFSVMDSRLKRLVSYHEYGRSF